jgi:hypothetical protein
MCDVSAERKEQIYELGKFHHFVSESQNLAAINFKESEMFRIKLPDWISHYKELEVLSAKSLGKQTLISAKVINQVGENEISSPSLYHLHGLHFQKTSTSL